MNTFGVWLARSPLASALKSFGAVLLTLAVAEWTASGSISFDRWQTWLIAAIASAAPVVVNAMNPQDKRYGRAASRPAVVDPGDAHYGEQP